MKNKNRVISIIILFIVVGFIYIFFFLLDVESIPLFLFLTIGSVAVLSTGTIYTIVQSKENSYEYLRKKKAMLLQRNPLQKKALKKSQVKEFIEDYFEANPLVDSYADSNESNENIPKINDYIFSVFSQEELEKISQLGFSKMDKIFFIRELLYFDPAERNQLIETMIKSNRIVDDSIIYTPPNKIIGIDDKIRIYVRSLVESGEKTKIIVIETTEFVNVFKHNIGVLFDYNQDKFLISSGGILLDETLKINDYNIEDDDEIALIPVRKKEK